MGCGYHYSVGFHNNVTLTYYNIVKYKSMKLHLISMKKWVPRMQV